MKASNFDKKFDSGEDITKFLDLANAKRPGFSIKQINLGVPSWMLDALDREAHRIGTTRQALIKFWIINRLEQHRNAGN